MMYKYILNIILILSVSYGSSWVGLNSKQVKSIDPLVVSWGYESEMPSHSKFLDYHQWQGTNDLSTYLTIPDVINFLDIVKKLSMIMKLREFDKYRYISPKNFNQIKNLSSYVRLKVNNLCI